MFTGIYGNACDGACQELKLYVIVLLIQRIVICAAVNNGEISYNDIHLSQMAQELRYGFLGKVNLRLLKLELTADGKIYLTAAEVFTYSLSIGR